MNGTLFPGRQGQIVGAVHRHRGRALLPLHPLTLLLELLHGMGKRQSLSLAGAGLRNRSHPGEERRRRLSGEVGL